MITVILKVVIGAAGLLFVAWLIPGITIDNFYAALIAAVVLGVLNLTVKPILFILTLPITIITLGMFTFVINACVFLFAASFLEGFDVDGFVPALLGSILISLMSTLTNRILD